MSENVNKLIIGTLFGTWPGASLVVIFVLVLLYLISPHFRGIISALFARLIKVGIFGFGPSTTADSDFSDQSKREIQPEQIADQSSDASSKNEDTEDALLLKMVMDTFEREDIESLNQTYVKLKNLPNRIKTDEDIQRHWFEMRAFLDDNVENELLALTESHPRWYFPYIFLAELYLKVDAITQAVKYWELAFDRAYDDNEKREAHYVKADILVQSEGEDKALNYLESVESNPEWSEFKDYQFVKMADYWGELGDKVRQQFMLEKSLIINPTDTTLRFKLAFYYGEDRRTYLLAVYHYLILLKKEPKNASALNNLAILYDKLGARAEYDKYINYAIKHGSSRAKGNYIIDLLEKNFVTEAEKLINSLSSDEKKEERVIDAIRYLEETKKTKKEEISQISTLPKIYKKYVDIAIKNFSFNSSQLAGVWRCGNNQLILKLDQAQKLSGRYTITPSGLLGLSSLVGDQSSSTNKNYIVSGDFKSGMLEILCIENQKASKDHMISSLLASDKISFRLVLDGGQLKGFVWHKSDVPSEVVFAPES